MKCINKFIIALIFCLVSEGSFAQRGIPQIVLNTLGHSGKVFNILFTPDGKKIISVSEDKTIRVWSACK